MPSDPLDESPTNLEVTRTQHRVATEWLVTDSTADSATAEMLLTSLKCKRRIGVCYVVPCAQAKVHYRSPDLHGMALQ